jgi:predicted transcriptional regulator
MKSSQTSGRSAVLTIRVSKELDRKLAREARRLRRTRSEIARVLLESALSETPDEDPVSEARRQSRLASERQSDREALTFIADVADLRGWT